MVVRPEGATSLWSSSQLRKPFFGESRLVCDIGNKVVVRPKGTTSLWCSTKLGKPTWCERGVRVAMNRAIWMRGRRWEGWLLSSVRESTSISCYLGTSQDTHTQDLHIPRPPRRGQGVGVP